MAWLTPAARRERGDDRRHASGAQPNGQKQPKNAAKAAPIAAFRRQREPTSARKRLNNRFYRAARISIRTIFPPMHALPISGALARKSHESLAGPGSGRRDRRDGCWRPRYARHARGALRRGVEAAVVHDRGQAGDIWREIRALRHTIVCAPARTRSGRRRPRPWRRARAGRCAELGPRS